MLSRRPPGASTCSLVWTHSTLVTAPVHDVVPSAYSSAADIHNQCCTLLQRVAWVSRCRYWLVPSASNRLAAHAKRPLLAFPQPQQVILAVSKAGVKGFQMVVAERC